MGRIWRALRAAAAEMRTGTDAFWRRLMDDSGVSGLSSGVVVTADTAMAFAAFYAAVDRISSDIAKLPLKLMRRSNNGNRDPARNHKLYGLLHDSPNEEQTSFIFRQSMMSNALRWGNSYAEIVRDGGGGVAALYPIDPQTMRVERRGEGRLLYIHQPESGGEVPLTPDRVIHIRAIGDGYVGLSPVRLFRETIGLGLAAEKAGASFFGGGMRPGGVLEHPATLSDPAYKRLRDQVESQAAGAGKQGKLLITEEGMKYQQLSIPPDDAQYLETRVFQVRDICRIFRLPPHKLADLADATFSNVEEQNREYVDDCLAPWIIQWEQEIIRKLLLENERPVYYPRFEFEGMLRGNATTRAAFYSTMFQVGGYSVNEIREKEDMNGIGPDGDQHLVPLNLQPAGTVVKPPDKAPSADDRSDEPDPTKERGARFYAAGAHVLLVRETCDRICRERERTGKRDDARHGMLLQAPMMCAAAAAGASVDIGAITRLALAETMADAMTTALIKGISG